MAPRATAGRAGAALHLVLHPHLLHYTYTHSYTCTHTYCTHCTCQVWDVTDKLGGKVDWWRSRSGHRRLYATLQVSVEASA